MKEKLIGLYQLITGIFGAILLAFSIPKAIKVPEMLPLYLLGLALFVGVAYAGYALLNKLKHAVTISIWAQALQILGFSYSGVQYLFTGSAFLSLAYKGRITSYNVCYTKLLRYRIG